jgi:phage repressor protein C with HTH and peptisase S24 domain
MFDLAKRYEHYAKRMRDYMGARNITGEMAAGMIGAHPTTIYDLRRGAQKLDDEWRAKVAAGFGVDHDVLFGDAPLPRPRPSEIREPKRRGRKPRPSNDNIPMYGLAAASLAGSFNIVGTEPDTVPCPPALRDVPEAYALKTTGESMVPRYLPGDRLYINPNQSARPGDHVVLQTHHNNDTTETWVKRYEGADKTHIFVYQYNPPARISFDKRYVNYMHRVLPVNELFGD